ncbi:hypothetical protein HDV00_007175 [Rhizophlyctis rosea]|nr:hypothetical protein HDV00_007175 [Rhizophlyctis rosea]
MSEAGGLIIDPGKLSDITYLLNGLNLFASLYFSIKSIHIAFLRRKFFWYLLVATHLVLFMSMVQTFADPLIFETCRAGKFGCMTYGLFYCCVTSVGYYRLWVLSRKKKVYVVFWLASCAFIFGSYVWMCIGSTHEYHPFGCVPLVPAFREVFVAIAEISTAVLLIFCHLYEIWSFRKVTKFTSAGRGAQATTIGGYFRDTIWCIVPAAFVTTGCKIASIYVDKATFLMVVMLQSVVEDTLMYEASVLLVRYGTSSQITSAPGGTDGLGSAHSHSERNNFSGNGANNNNGTYRTVQNQSGTGGRPGYFWSGDDEKEELSYASDGKSPSTIHLPTYSYSMSGRDLYPPSPRHENSPQDPYRQDRYKRSNSVDHGQLSMGNSPPRAVINHTGSKPTYASSTVSGMAPPLPPTSSTPQPGPVRSPSVPNLNDLPYQRSQDGPGAGRYRNGSQSDVGGGQRDDRYRNGSQSDVGAGPRDERYRDAEQRSASRQQREREERGLSPQRSLNRPGQSGPVPPLSHHGGYGQDRGYGGQQQQRGGYYD